jgi:hypothetical protein
MSKGESLPHVAVWMLVLLLLAGCGSPQATPTETAVPPTEAPMSPTATFTLVPPTATSTPVPPTATFTPVPATSTFTPVPPTATPAAFAIRDEGFQADYEGECLTDCELISVDGELRIQGGIVEERGGRLLLWCYAARHTWIGVQTYAGHTFASDQNAPLQFRVDRDRGYVYVNGKGSVTLPDGTVVTLPT